ncbi:uncharacterized protein BJ171DRAFT_570610 [Polychytrium aggregatum]|uniref:uncharacterized protein n=1 Tax=Polychytrium aggregatum TaxID=110093 RepID=UPI0022FE4DF5|nr:uncharacterized protein BJ171DRAFT_570610 [Polychytrium aggregatum]KAI9199221.1 hypothetical protein BJ171DRAFT_570610 [Polychytrium aggregatum]
MLLFRVSPNLPHMGQGVQRDRNPGTQQHSAQRPVFPRDGFEDGSVANAPKYHFQGNRHVREKILCDFVANNRHKTGPQLEREFGNGASLFLNRVTSWLRLTTHYYSHGASIRYLLGYNLALQLQAVSIFVSASSGHRFLSEFLEVGGVMTVLEIIGLPQIKEAEKAEGLRLLLHIASAGRKYKEFICESYGVRSVTDCLARSKSEVTQDYARNLLYQLGLGNPRFLVQVYKSLLGLLTSGTPTPTAQQMAGQAVRMLLPHIQTVHPSVVEITIGLLKSINIQVQYEGYEILRSLSERSALQDVVIQQLIAILKISVDDYIEDMNEARGRRQKGQQEGAGGGASWQGMLTKSEETAKKQNDALMSTYVQQAYAAKLLGIMAAGSKEIAERQIQLQIISGLLNVIANLGHPESQKYAASALIYLVETFDYVGFALQETMGQNFFELLEFKPDTFFKELTREQVRYLRRNNVKIVSAESTSSLIEDDSSSVSSGEAEESSRPTTRSARSAERKPKSSGMEFPSSREGDMVFGEKKGEGEKSRDIEPVQQKTQDEVLSAYEKLADQQNQAAPNVQEMYLPYNLGPATATFSSNKFEPVSKKSADDSFELEMHMFRARNAEKSIQTKKREFDVLEKDPEMMEKLNSLRGSPDLFKKNIPLKVDDQDVTATRIVPENASGSEQAPR